MILTITNYDRATGNHHAIDEQGHLRHIDIMIDTTLSRPQYESIDQLHAWCNSLIGSKIQVDRLTPYVEIAHGVKLLTA